MVQQDASCLVKVFPLQKQLDSAFHLIPYLPDLFQGQPLRVLEGPVTAAQAGNVWTVLAATHGDEQVCLPGQLRGKFLRLCMAEVDACLPHNSLDFRMDAGAWLGAC